MFFRNIVHFQLCLLTSILVVFGASLGTASAGDLVRSITIVSTSQMSVKPDRVQITTGVQSEAETAKEALEKNSQAMARIVDELKASEIEPRDIQTINFSVNPRYQHFKNGQPSRIIGYQVINSVKITVKSPERLGPILDKIVSHGSNRINGIRFSISKRRDLLNKLREDAIKSAKQKAKLYVEAAGAKLGDLITISEGYVAPPPGPVLRQSRSMAQAEVAPPIEAGQQTIQVRVTVTWEIEK